MKTLQFHAEDIGKGPLILINPSHPLACEPRPGSLVSVSPDHAHILLEQQAAKMLAQLTTVLGCDGQIVPVSGYRTLPEQEALYDDSMRKHGEDFTRKYVAIPGCSEHQSGLAIDLSENRPDYDSIRPDFPYTGICQTFREKSAAYGYVERYPAGGEAITQIAHEPWHFRYVGYPHAQIMQEQGFTLEQYTDYVRQFPYHAAHLQFQRSGRNYEIFFVPTAPGQVVQVEIAKKTPFQVSGNNQDGFVVTLFGNPQG